MSVGTGSSIDSEITAAFARKVEARIVQEKLTSMPRGAHPRHHGIVRADFHVPQNLPPDLRKGLFAGAGTYPAYVRFSNAGTDPHDGTPDARGMAIKVMGVVGEKFLPDEQMTQDFLLVSHPVFIARDPKEFLEFLILRGKIKDAQATAPASLPALVAELNSRFPNVPKSVRVIRNPLTVSYFSQTAYELGSDSGLAVKYCAQPRVAERAGELSPSEAAAKPPDYLQQAMDETLRRGEDVTFEFMVQRRTDPGSMPVDDPTTEWDQAKSPFVSVATIVIKGGQTFTSPAQMKFADDISLNPWHALKDHTPLGGVNEARRDVYVQMVQLRHARNRVVAFPEPTGRETF